MCFEKPKTVDPVEYPSTTETTRGPRQENASKPFAKIRFPVLINNLEPRIQVIFFLIELMYLQIVICFQWKKEKIGDEIGRFKREKRS